MPCKCRGLQTRRLSGWKRSTCVAWIACPKCRSQVALHPPAAKICREMAPLERQFSWYSVVLLHCRAGYFRVGVECFGRVFSKLARTRRALTSIFTLLKYAAYETSEPTHACLVHHSPKCNPGDCADRVRACAARHKTDVSNPNIPGRLALSLPENPGRLSHRGFFVPQPLAKGKQQ